MITANEQVNLEEVEMAVPVKLPYEDITGQVNSSRIMTLIKNKIKGRLDNYLTIKQRAKNLARLYRRYSEMEPECDVTLQVLIWEVFVDTISIVRDENSALYVLRSFEKWLHETLSALEDKKIPVYSNAIEPLVEINETVVSRCREAIGRLEKEFIELYMEVYNGYR